MEFFLDCLLDALWDSAKLLPFLFAAYLAIEYIERSHGSAIEGILARGGKGGFLAGGILGCVPQCGFSAMAADLYACRVISLGTLMAVFLATSDEALPMMIAVPQCWPQLAFLIGFKLVFSVVAGFLIDYALRGVIPAGLRGGYAGAGNEVDCHEEHEEESSLLAAAAFHTAEVFGFILLFNLLIDIVIGLIGEEALQSALAAAGIFSPFVAALFGLVPNCASSVLITQLYLQGGLSLSAAVAGLCSGAGIGLAVLWRTNPGKGQNLFITLLLWLLGSGAGLILMLLGF